jgi:hypothetical protein
MEEGTNPKIAFISNCTALVLSVESEERKLSMTPTSARNEVSFCCILHQRRTAVTLIDVIHTNENQ